MRAIAEGAIVASELSADDVRACMDEFDRAMRCLALELPEAVHRDVYAMWRNLRTLIDGSESGA